MTVSIRVLLAHCQVHPLYLRTTDNANHTVYATSEQPADMRSSGAGERRRSHMQRRHSERGPGPLLLRSRPAGHPAVIGAIADYHPVFRIHYDKESQGGQPMSQTTPPSSRKRTANQVSSSGGNAVYGLGLIGALVYFWQQADSFGGYLLAILKALVWPALLVYEAFQRLHG
jgi:hypothetical protein